MTALTVPESFPTGNNIGICAGRTVPNCGNGRNSYTNTGKRESRSVPVPIYRERERERLGYPQVKAISGPNRTSVTGTVGS